VSYKFPLLLSSPVLIIQEVTAAYYHGSVICRSTQSLPVIHLPCKMGGFDFSNYNRNASLHAKGLPLPKATSTGTTIVGCIFNGGVVIAADTRATSGSIVADKVGTKPLHVKTLSNPPIRTVRNSITLLQTFGVQVPVPLQTQNLPQPLQPPISNYMLSLPDENPVSKHV
jgi:hypothetical protein